MIAADDDSATSYGFEISIDEAAYLVEYLDLTGLLPEVLAVFNPMTRPELAQDWKDYQHHRLTERGILTPTGALPEVATLMRTLAHAEETLAIRITPMHEEDTMLRVAIARRFDSFVVASRTRHIFLVQPVPSSEWPDAAQKVIDAQLGTAEPAPLAQTVQLTIDDVKRAAQSPPGATTDILIELGVPPGDAAILNAASKPDVYTEITAARRYNGIVRRSTTAVTILDTARGRVMAWPHIGPDRSTWISYAAGESHRLTTAIPSLFEQFDTD